MKIGFRQALAAAVSALLLFSSAGAWAECEAELEQAKRSLDATDNSTSAKQQMLKEDLLKPHQEFVEIWRGNYSYWREQNKTRDTGFADYLVGEAEAARRTAKRKRDEALTIYRDNARNVIYVSDHSTFLACRMDFAAKSQGSSGGTVNQNQSNRPQNQALQQALSQAQSNANNARTAQQSGRLKNRDDLLCYDCDVGDNGVAQNGSNLMMHFVTCTVSDNGCANGSFRAYSLAPGQKMPVASAASYFVASCKAPGRPYNYRYLGPQQGIQIFCGEF